MRSIRRSRRASSTKARPSWWRLSTCTTHAAGFEHPSDDLGNQWPVHPVKRRRERHDAERPEAGGQIFGPAAAPTGHSSRPASTQAVGPLGSFLRRRRARPPPRRGRRDGSVDRARPAADVEEPAPTVEPERLLERLGESGSVREAPTVRSTRPRRRTASRPTPTRTTRRAPQDPEVPRARCERPLLAAPGLRRRGMAGPPPVRNRRRLGADLVEQPGREIARALVGREAPAGGPEKAAAPAGRVSGSERAPPCPGQNSTRSVLQARLARVVRTRLGHGAAGRRSECLQGICRCRNQLGAQR